MAATLDDILASSKRIEALLGKSSGTTGSLGRSPPKAAGTNQVTGQGTSNDDKNQKKTYKATAASLDDLGDAADGLNKKFGGLGKTVDITRGNFVAMNRSMRATYRGKDTGGAGGSQKIQQAGKPGAGSTAGDPAGPMSSFFQRVFGSNGGGVGSKVESSLEDMVGGLSYTKTAIIAVASQLVKAIEPIVLDFFALRAAGIDAQSALTGLYVDALKSGMSLAEYTKVIQDSNAVVSRSTSMDDFNKKLQGSVDTLANFGIYGADATKMAAELATSLTVAGVAQKDLNSVSDPLLKQFGVLQASMGLSIGQFEELTKSLFNNENVQSELIGLDKNQRAGRIIELMQIKTLGFAMGGTAKQSEALAQAMLDQRNASVEDLIKQSATMRQYGASAGLNSADTDRLAQLNQLGEARTADESAEFAKLAQPFAKQLQSDLSSRDLGIRYRAQQFQTGIGGANGILKAAGAIATTAESGPNAGVNKQFSKGASDFEKGAGFLLTWAEGAAKNPIGHALIAAVGAATSFITIEALLKRVFNGKGASGVLGGAAKAGSGVSAAADTGKSIGAVGKADAGMAQLMADVSHLLKTGAELGTSAEAGAATVSKSSKLINGIKLGWSAILDAVSWFATGVSKSADAALNAGEWIFKIGDSIFKGFQTFWATITDSQKLAVAAGETLGKIVNGFEDAWKLVTNGFSSIKGTVGGIAEGAGKAFTGVVDTIKTTVGGGLDTISGVFKGAGSALEVAGDAATVASKGAGLLKSIPLIGNIAGMFIDAVGEAFTGNLAAALDPKGGMLTRLEAVAMAGFSAIPQFFIDAATFIFGDEMMKPLQAVFDIARTGVQGMMNFLYLGILQTVSFLTDMLPKNSGLRKMIDSAKDSVGQAVEGNIKAVETMTDGLISGDVKTLKDMSDSTKAAAADADKKSKDATKTVVNANDKFNNVLYGTDGITGSIVSSAAAVDATGQAAQGPPMIATPGPQPQSGVTPPPVNTPADAAAVAAQAASDQLKSRQVDLGQGNGWDATTQVAAGTPDMATQLATVIAILQQQLDIEKAHAATSDAILRNNDKTYFADTGTMFNQVNAIA